MARLPASPSLLVGLALALCPAAASAGWQGFEWGTSYGELRDDRRVEPNVGNDPEAPSRDEAPLGMVYEASGFAFSAYFVLGASDLPPGLAAVILVADVGTDCRLLGNRLSETYEQGAEPLDDRDAASWLDRAHQARVSFEMQDDRCAVVYEWWAPPGAPGGL